MFLSKNMFFKSLVAASALAVHNVSAEKSLWKPTRNDSASAQTIQFWKVQDYSKFRMTASSTFSRPRETLKILLDETNKLGEGGFGTVHLAQYACHTVAVCARVR